MDERKFEDVVRSIEMSEKDVDRILKAAKLQRNPGMSDRRFESVVELIGMIAVMAFMLGMFALMVLG